MSQSYIRKEIEGFDWFYLLALGRKGVKLYVNSDGKYQETIMSSYFNGLTEIGG